LTAKLQDGAATGLPSVGALFWCVATELTYRDQDLAAFQTCDANPRPEFYLSKLTA